MADDPCWYGWIRTLQEQAPHAYCLRDLTHNRVWRSPELKRLEGVPPSDPSEMPFGVFARGIHPEDVRQNEAFARRALEDHQSYRLIMRLADGHNPGSYTRTRMDATPIHCANCPLGACGLILATFRPMAG